MEKLEKIKAKNEKNLNLIYSKIIESLWSHISVLRKEIHDLWNEKLENAINTKNIGIIKKAKAFRLDHEEWVFADELKEILGEKA